MWLFIIPDDIPIVMERLKNFYDLRVFEDKDPYRVLVRTILSQRTRDENTDRATSKLFNVYSNIDEISVAPLEDIEKLIKSAGFYRVKAKRIKEVSNIIIDEYNGIVPNSLNELIKLPGVGRKTANCVLVYAFEKPGIPVDTHVHRISNLWGLVDTKTPDETEKELRKIVTKKYWIELNDLMVQFGQDICKPIGSKHDECPISEFCDEYNNNVI